MIVTRYWNLGSVLVSTAVALVNGPLFADEVSFRDQIAPILERHCLSCHEGAKPKGGLSLATAKQALGGGETGRAVVPGNPDESLLLDYISGDEPAMPKDAKPLPAEDVSLIRKWIEQGAPWPDDIELTDKKLNDTEWWSLKPLDESPPPQLQSPWIRTPIDAFILAKQQEHGLAPSAEADRHTLIRRLYFDLTGLPPSPEEVETFVADPDSLAYEKLVDRLLASPHYGERWGRHWLDVVHYGDTHGYDKDKVRPHAWPYRDYVIRSFNKDKPYERFVLEQVAGDRLYPNSSDGIIATGFVVAGPFDYVGQIEVAEGTLSKAVTRNLDRDDMVTTTMNTFNSMTVQCARCHNHKFDPITQEDYYSLQAVFAGIDRAPRPYGKSKPKEKSQTDTAQSDKSTQAPDKKAKPDSKPKLVYAVATEFEADGSFTPSHGKPRPVFLLTRGNEATPAQEVGPGAASYLTALPTRFSVPAEDEGARRVALARWLVDPQNVLTWRSIVNRVWQYHFGRGIVDSSNDFGRMGTLPSHPELLDWLAREFRDGGEWISKPQSLKQLHRLICMSAVYRQSSAGNAKFDGIDGDNQFLWRANRRRLEAEAVRDSILAVAGKLNSKRGGPGFKAFGFEDDHSPRYKYESYDPDDPACHRRSVYRFIVRSVPDPLMTTLDCADSSAAVAKRTETLTALQSLALLNNPFVVRMAEHFAARSEKQGTTPAEHLSAAVRFAFGRDPAAGELTLLEAYAQKHGMANACRLIFNMNEFLFVD